MAVSHLHMVYVVITMFSVPPPSPSVPLVKMVEE